MVQEARELAGAYPVCVCRHCLQHGILRIGPNGFNECRHRAYAVVLDNKPHTIISAYLEWLHTIVLT